MSNALMRGRTLDPVKANVAKKAREAHVNMLKAAVRDGTATPKERRELRWKWGVKIEGNEVIG